MPLRPSHAKPPALPAKPAHQRLLVIGVVLVAAAGLIGFGLSRPTTPSAFDLPAAQKPFHH
jgi:hypothetical protein